MLNKLQNNKSIACGFVKIPKDVVAEFWKSLTEELNCAGPPIKNVTEMKNVIFCFEYLIFFYKSLATPFWYPPSAKNRKQALSFSIGEIPKDFFADGREPLSRSNTEINLKI